jgi:hypothetical protein
MNVRKRCKAVAHEAAADFSLVFVEPAAEDAAR